MGEDPGNDRRLARLAQELEDEIGLVLTDEALEELAYARFMQPHEGRKPAYGAAVWNQPSSDGSGARSPLPSAGVFVDSDASIGVLRTFADGRTSFLVRGPSMAPSIAVDPEWRGTEPVLAAFAAVNDVTLIQRLGSGRIRIFLGDHVYAEDGGIWLKRPTASAYHVKLASVIEEEHHGTARGILDLCVHTLSPAGHGATLVWFPGGLLEEDEHLDTALGVEPPRLFASDPTHGPAIAHALGQMDRAIVLAADSRLVQLNVTLQHAESVKELTFIGGTRHNSAGRYSASRPEAVVFVVSADGPVTVMIGGDLVASIE
jgi:hypothetical protein